MSELDTSARAAATFREANRFQAIKSLIMGIEPPIVCELFNVADRSLRRWVDSFNTSGIDGLIEGEHTGRRRVINPEQSERYEKLIEDPKLAGQTHWTGVKFHGYLREQCDHEVGYRTVIPLAARTRFSSQGASAVARPTRRTSAPGLC